MKKIFLLKDLARASGISIYTLKYYYKRGLFKEIGRSSETSYRYFDEQTVDRLGKIRNMRKKGISVKEIKETLCERQ